MSAVVERQDVPGVSVSGEVAAEDRLPLNHRIHPIFGSFRINKPKGYPRINSGPHKNKYLHRAVFEHIAGRPVRAGFHVHHMNGKLCFCPHQLVEIEAALHPAPQPLRHPYTGRYMTPKEFEREMGFAAYS